MKSDQLKSVGALIGVMVCASVLSIWLAAHFRAQMVNVSMWSGWILLVGFVLIALFNLRKRLPGLPLLPVRYWLNLHVFVGGALIGVFWAHSGLWPKGAYEQVLAGLVYALVVGGFIGFVLQKIMPLRLNQVGIEAVYEEIPARMAQIERTARAQVLDAVQSDPQSVLATHYSEVIAPYLRQPRHMLGHLMGGVSPRRWRQHQAMAIEKYLEGPSLDRFHQVLTLIDEKMQLDAAFAYQAVMKRWLLLHVPLSAVTLLLIFWHVLIVHVYAL